MTKYVAFEDGFIYLIMKEGVKLHNHQAEFDILMMQMINAGEKLEDEEETLLLLRLLPKSYKSLVQTMLVGRIILKFKNVIIVLLENDRWLEVNNSDANNEVLAIKNSSRGMIMIVIVGAFD